MANSIAHCTVVCYHMTFCKDATYVCTYHDTYVRLFVDWSLDTAISLAGYLFRMSVPCMNGIVWAFCSARLHAQWGS